MAKFYYGGQAVIEGVMMRGRKQMAVAVRAPNGEIVMHEEPLTAAIYTRKWGQWPFVRGLAMLWDALGLGMRALLWSADVSLQEEGQEPVKFTGPVAWTTIALSLALAVGIFFLLPTLAAKLLAPLGANALVGQPCGRRDPADALPGLPVGHRLHAGHPPGVCLSWRRAQDDQRVRSRRAAHPGDVARFSTSHTRCGTSFLLSVMVIAIFVFAPFHFDNLFLRLLSRIILIPVVAGIAYEFMRFTAGHLDWPWVRALIKPGLQLQRLTTREPDEKMLECAIAALKPVLAADGIQLDAAVEVQPTPVTVAA